MSIVTSCTHIIVSIVLNINDFWLSDTAYVDSQIPNIGWNEITLSFPNFNGTTVEV